VFGIFKKKPVHEEISRTRSTSNLAQQVEQWSQTQVARKPAPATRTDLLLDPLPAPQVQEGNSEEDWTAWEDSVLTLDSQLGALDGAGASRPASLASEETDAFAAVRRRDA